MNAHHHHDDRSAALARRITDPAYAHAENILVRLRQLEQIIGDTELAVDVIYSEIVKE